MGNCLNKGCSSCYEGAHNENVHSPLERFRATSYVCPLSNSGSDMPLASGTNSGAIIPFSAGISQVLLAFNAAGETSSVTAIGFGTAVTNIIPTNNTIILPVASLTEAFNVTRSGTITAISATYTNRLSVPLLTGTVTFTAQIYRAPAGSNVYTPTNAFVDLTPSVSGIVATNAVFQGTASSNVPVSAGESLVMIFYATGTGTTETLGFLGRGSAGIAIA